MNNECRAYMNGMHDGLRAIIENRVDCKLENLKDEWNKQLVEMMYQVNDIAVTQELYNRLQPEPKHNGMPREAYILQLVPVSGQVICRECYEYGHLALACSECKVKDTHEKIYKHWIVKPKTETIVKVDRDSRTGMLRYWTLTREFCEFYEEVIGYPETPHQACVDLDYYPNGIHMVHFNLDEAKNECERLNKILIKKVCWYEPDEDDEDEDC